MIYFSSTQQRMPVFIFQRNTTGELTFSHLPCQLNSQFPTEKKHFLVITQIWVLFNCQHILSGYYIYWDKTTKHYYIMHECLDTIYTLLIIRVWNVSLHVKHFIHYHSKFPCKFIKRQTMAGVAGTPPISHWFQHHLWLEKIFTCVWTAVNHAISGILAV